MGQAEALKNFKFIILSVKQCDYTLYGIWSSHSLTMYTKTGRYIKITDINKETDDIGEAHAMDAWAFMRLAW